MKNSKAIVAMAAVMLLAASGLKAEGLMDFDGKKGAAMSLKDLLKASAPVQEVQASPVAPAVPTAPAAGAEVKIAVTMKNGAAQKTETLLCRRGESKDAVSQCRKQSDLAFLTAADIEGLSLRKFFPDIMQTKHSYDGKNGPQTFHCDDACARWTTVKRCIGVEVGSGGGCLSYSEEQVCTSWTHECSCTSNCY